MSNSDNNVFDKVIENTILVQMKNNIASNENLGVSQEYDRGMYDNVYKRQQFKKEYFGDKKTQQDYITGETVHSSTKAARAKYGDKAYTKHSTDIDHIIPENTAYERLKKNPFLSDDDVNEIINAKSNYRPTTSKLNRQKGASSNIELALDKDLDLSVEARAKLVGDHARSSAHMAVNTTVRTVKNVSGEFVDGAVNSLEASAIPLMIEGVHNLYLVAAGEKTFEDAAKDMGKLTTSVAVSGGGLKVAATGLNNVMRNSGTKALQQIANSNQVAQIITVALILKDSVIKYVNGDIDGKEFFEEIGEKGVGLVSGSIGAIVGQIAIPIPVVGAAIGSIIVSTVCLDIYKTYRTIDSFKDKEKQVNSLASQALAEIERQQKVLKSIIEQEFTNWDKHFDSGFELIYNGTLDNDVDKIADGLGSLLSVFGEEAAFKTYDDFDKFFMNEESVFVL